MSKPLSPLPTKTDHDGQPIRLAISTCPNDTFAFHAILENKIDLGGLTFDTQLLDIQQLNDGLFQRKFDIAKSSFHAAALLTDQTVVLPSGSALGFGVGPLLLAARPEASPSRTVESDSSSTTITLCPGQHTTATMLFHLFYADAIRTGKTVIEQALFSDIMARLKSESADFGVCIHEGRFTWEQDGLFLVEDLGTRWEQATGSPLPLGGILARRDLGNPLIEKIQTVIANSIDYGLNHRDEALITMRRYAQELNDEVLFQHVDLYVNEWTVNLGSVGVESLRVLSHKARESGLICGTAPDIEVWSADAP